MVLPLQSFMGMVIQIASGNYEVSTIIICSIIYTLLFADSQINIYIHIQTKIKLVMLGISHHDLKPIKWK